MVVVVVVVSWFLFPPLASPRSEELHSAEVASHARTTIDTIFMFDIIVLEMSVVLLTVEVMYLVNNILYE